MRENSRRTRQRRRPRPQRERVFFVEMADAHPVRTGIIATTVGGLLVALILWALGFVGVVWRGLGSAVSWAWHHLTASTPLPTWLVLAVAGYAIAATALLRRRGTSPPRQAGEAHSRLREGDPHVAPRKLDRLQVKVMRAIAEADGATPTIEEMADDLDLSQLRLEPALEGLEEIGYLRIIRHVTHGPVVEVT